MRCVLRRVLGVCGLCRGCVQGIVGRVRCVWGVYVVCACGAFVGCVLGRVWRGGGAVVERKYRSPLYYPDTLVNLDTCLGESRNLCNAFRCDVLSDLPPLCLVGEWEGKTHAF